jgi:hypothetical protein
MEIHGLDLPERRKMAQALRRGETIRLVLDALPEAGWVDDEVFLDEILPLCHEVISADRGLQATADLHRAPVAEPGSAQSSTSGRVTALIPSHRRVPLGLSALRGQDVDVRVRVLSNGPQGPANVHGAEVIRTTWRGHGLTRRAAIEVVEDPFVLLMVDDAIPLGAGFVRTLVHALESGPWDAVVARQLPWPDTDPVTRARLRAWTPPGAAVVETTQVDHVCALYRTETLRAHPLPGVAIAEDLWWSQGKRVGYVPTAPVIHAHERRPTALYTRNRAIHAERARMGLAPTVPDFGALLGALPGLVRPTLQGGAVELANQVAEILGQWQGARDGAPGEP